MAQTASQVFLSRFSRIGSVLVVLMGGLVLLGWWLNLEVLKSLGPGFVAMPPSTAILFVFAGGALWRLSARKPTPPSRVADRIALMGGLLVVLGGVFKLAEYFFHIELALDQLLFQINPQAGGTFSPTEIAPNTAFNFLFCGVGLVWLDFETRRGFRAAQAFLLVGGLIALLALIGYTYRVLPLYGFGSATPMALNTAMAFELLCLSALAARPDRGIMRVITSDTTGGAMARRLLPAAILIPLVLGALRYISEQRGYFEIEFGISLFAVANMVLFALLIWWYAKLLFLAERERQHTERRVAVQYGVTRVLAESPTVTDATRKILQAICANLDWRAGAMWRVDERKESIRCVQAWRINPEPGGEYVETTTQSTLEPGADLPGRIWRTGRPAWIPDVTEDNNFSRISEASQAGWRAAFGFPIKIDNAACGVMEFFSDRVEPPDEALLGMLEGVGSQIGQFIERKHAEEQLKQASADLARSNTELQQFAYIASHDLSEPLRMVVSYLQLLEDHSRSQLDAESREFIGYAVDGAQRMRALITDLLAYARVDTRGRVFRPTDCEEILQAALNNLKVRIEETGTRIEHAPLPRVKADSVQLIQVFQNFIGNAIKFRGPQTPHVHVGARRAGNEWVFHVKDNGIGIDARNFERIFVLFQRLHTRQEYSGTGMGLAICKKIIERHGGRIWVESQGGQGTTFFFTLPEDERN